MKVTRLLRDQKCRGPLAGLAYNNGTLVGKVHGVEFETRSNRLGLPFEPVRDDYQEGECSHCGHVVYSEKLASMDFMSFSPWQLKTHLIYEEDTLEDLLAG